MTAARKPSFHYSAGGIVYFGREVLLISTVEATRWQLPKGHIERGESPMQAAIREVREETGVVSHVVEELGPLEYRYRSRFGHPVVKRVDYFLCSYVSGTAEDFDRGEVSGAAWLTWSEALERLTFNNERDLVERAFRVWQRLTGIAQDAETSTLGSESSV